MERSQIVIFNMFKNNEKDTALSSQMPNLSQRLLHTTLTEHLQK